MKRPVRGFTLIELLVVIAIIGILSAVTLSALSVARAKARDSKRLSDLQEIRTALALYYTDKGSYPVASPWSGNCSTWGSKGTSGPDGWIPNLAPNYIASLPVDPKPIDPAGCYMYTSNGTDYMVMAYSTVETYTAGANKWMRPSQPATPTNFSFYSEGGVGF